MVPTNQIVWVQVKMIHTPVCGEPQKLPLPDDISFLFLKNVGKTKMTAATVTDPSKVVASGEGLTFGYINHSIEAMIDTRGAGPGGQRRAESQGNLGCSVWRLGLTVRIVRAGSLTHELGKGVWVRKCRQSACFGPSEASAQCLVQRDVIRLGCFGASVVGERTQARACQNTRTILTPGDTNYMSLHVERVFETRSGNIKFLSTFSHDSTIQTQDPISEHSVVCFSTITNGNKPSQSSS